MDTSPFSQLQGIALLAGYAAIVSLVVFVFSRGYRATKLHFLVANREIGCVPAAFSIAAAWVWAPALFLAAEKAYTQGWVGLFWFTVPNAACLILFAFFAKRVRDMFPQGFTLSEYMRTRHSKRVQRLYISTLGMLAVCSFAVQLLAGGKVISTLSGLPYPLVTVLLALIPIGYSLYSGLKASIISDFLQMGVILLVGGGIVSWAVGSAGGVDVVIRGLAGKTGTFQSLFSGDGLSVFYTFGIPVTIGLLSGPFGDQSFWQRAFSVERRSVRPAFIGAAFIFVLVPLMLSALGFLAAGMGLTISNTSRVNMEVVAQLLPGWVIIPFTYLLLAGLVSTLDSNLSAISSLAGHDILCLRRADTNASERKAVIRYAMIAMVLLAVCGVLIANIPKLTILYLFLFYGTLRASTLLPTIITILKQRVSEPGIFYGILTSLVVGLPIFAYGNLYKIVPMIIGGSLCSVLASGIIVLVATAAQRK